MGTKRPSVRTLPSGEKVLHHPPDERHPEGMLTLIRERSPLRHRHDARLHEHRRRHEEIKAVHQDRVDRKHAVQQANGVPAEKRVVG